jgi:hypothetical protein
MSNFAIDLSDIDEELEKKLEKKLAKIRRRKVIRTHKKVLKELKIKFDYKQRTKALDITKVVLLPADLKRFIAEFIPRELKYTKLYTTILKYSGFLSLEYFRNIPKNDIIPEIYSKYDYCIVGSLVRVPKASFVSMFIEDIKERASKPSPNFDNEVEIDYETLLHFHTLKKYLEERNARRRSVRKAENKKKK